MLIASQDGRNEIVSLLLKFGANPNIARFDGYTPVHIACQNGQNECLSILISSNADVDTKAFDDVSAVHLASQNNHPQCLSLLLNSKADPNTKVSSIKITALHTASQNGHWKCLKLLLDANADPNVQSITGDTPLHLTAENDKAQCMKLLLQANAYVDTITNGGVTALHKACLQGKYECALLLLKARANPNILVEVCSALDLAIRYDRQEIVKLLVKHGAQIDDCSVYSPLLLAVYEENYEIVKYLIEEGANINTQYKHSGITPLILASTKKTSIRIIQLLLEKGADQSMTDHDELTAYDTSIKHNNYEITQLLGQAHSQTERRSVTLQGPLVDKPVAASTKHEEMIETLFKFQMDRVKMLYKDQFKVPVYNTAELHQTINIE